MRKRKLSAAVTAVTVFTLSGCGFSEGIVEDILDSAGQVIEDNIESAFSSAAEEIKSAVSVISETPATTTEAATTTAEAAAATAEVTTTPAEAVTTEETVDYNYEVTYSFRNDKYLEQHFQKHGAEFGYLTEQEYVDGANSVIISADALHKTEKEDGDDIYYLEETNEFVVVSTDGYIRTYFKPSRGIDYFYAQ